MATALTPSEQLVTDLCRRTCLSLWSYNNPQNLDGKELCDVLVVFNHHLIIISVKEIGYPAHPDDEIAHKRWTKRAVDSSIDQIFGAERFLGKMSRVIQKDGSLGIELPSIENRIIHRIAVAFGGDGQAMISSGQARGPYVHVMNETSIRSVLSELDTVPDLVHYLAAKEGVPEGQKFICEDSERDILAFYLLSGRKFPNDSEILLFQSDLWEGLSTNRQYLERKEADRISYKCDDLIETLAGGRGRSLDGIEVELDQLEPALRELANQTRFQRRVLGQALAEFLNLAGQQICDARIVQNPENATIFVFRYFNDSYSPAERTAFIMATCYVALSRVRSAQAVIGVGFLEKDPKGTYELTFGHVKADGLTEQNFQEFEDLGKRSGIFQGASETGRHFDEYTE